MSKLIFNFWSAYVLESEYNSPGKYYEEQFIEYISRNYGHLLTEKRTYLPEEFADLIAACYDENEPHNKAVISYLRSFKE